MNKKLVEKKYYITVTIRCETINGCGQHYTRDLPVPVRQRLVFQQCLSQVCPTPIHSTPSSSISHPSCSFLEFSLESTTNPFGDLIRISHHHWIRQSAHSFRTAGYRWSVVSASHQPTAANRRCHWILPSQPQQRTPLVQYVMSSSEQHTHRSIDFSPIKLSR